MLDPVFLGLDFLGDADVHGADRLSNRFGNTRGKPVEGCTFREGQSHGPASVLEDWEEVP